MHRYVSESWKFVLVVTTLFFVIIPCCLWGTTVSLCVTLFSCIVASYYLTLHILQRNNIVSSDIILNFVKKLRTDTNFPVKSSYSQGTTDKPTGTAKSIDNQIYGAHCTTNVTIDSCIHFIMRDFVNSWYQSISCHNQFSNEVYYLMEDLSVALTSRLRKVKKYHTINKFIRLYHIYFKDYLSTLEKVRRKKGARHIFECLSMTQDIEENFVNWHQAMKDEHLEIMYMRHVINTLLEILTPIDILVCTLSRRILGEILVRNVMIPLMDFLSNPDWLNRKLIILLSDETDVHSNNYEKGSKEVIKNDDSSVHESDLLQQQESDVVDNVSEGDLKRSDNFSENNSQASENGSTEFLNFTQGHSIRCSRSSENSEKIVLINDGESIVNDVPLVTPTWQFARKHSIAETSTSGSNGKTGSSIPTSKSLEHLSSLFLNKLTDMEKPIEYITENLAQYFRVSNDHSKKTEIGDQQVPSRRESVVSRDGESQKNEFESFKSISTALGNVITASTGPVLSDNLELSSMKSCLQLPLEDSSNQTSSGENARDNSRLKLNLKSPATYFFQSTTKNLQSPESSDGVLEAVEMSPDNRCFMNLHIPRTEIAEEASGSGHYALYCIEYEAWFLDNTPPTTSETYTDESRMVLQGNQVKRRFREFSTLHSRLEENQRLRPYLHDIQKPNRWLSLPFSKTDRVTIEDRRVSLEKYLQKLISKDEIAAGTELREFLAYGSDASIAYVKKIPGGMVPRFDKFLVRKVSGMLEKIRTALPTLPSDTSPTDHRSARGFLGFQFGNQDDTYPILLQFGVTEKDAGNVEDHLRRFINDSQYGELADEVDAMAKELPTPISPTIPNQIFTYETNGKNVNHVSKDCALSVALRRQMSEVDAEVPLTSSILNLFIDIMTETETILKRESLLLVFKLLNGKLIESWVRNKIDEYTDRGMCIRYIGRIRDAIWPGGLLPMDPDLTRTEEDKCQTKEKTLHCLQNFLPGLMPLIIGEQQFHRCNELFLDSLQHPKLLRHFFYNVFDLLIDELAPETKSENFQSKFAYAV